jgi:hypothetical protein
MHFGIQKIFCKKIKQIYIHFRISKKIYDILKKKDSKHELL